MTALLASFPTHAPRLDPRYFQIMCLSGLLTYGVLFLGFDVQPAYVPVYLGSALVAQWVAGALVRYRSLAPAARTAAELRHSFSPRYFEPRSALISALSLCLLLRVASPVLAVAAAILVVATKFLIRVRGKHVFNPSNIAIVLLLAISPAAWASPGQWGSGVFLAFLFACLGGFVSLRALRSDIAIAFLAIYGSLVFARSLYLGEPVSIPLHRLENGAILLFAFFMISDPRSTPDSRAGRIVFAGLVAFGAAYIQFKLFRTNGLLWALAFASPLVPVLDRLLPGGRFEWEQTWRIRVKELSEL